MARLKWWMRTVGAFYLFLGIFNLPFVVQARLLGQYPNLGVPVDSAAARALVDTWFMFGLEMGVVGAALVFFSRNPVRHLALVWTVIALEVVRGVADDLYLIARGQDAVFYGSFALVHLAIIITGIVFARRALGTSAAAAEVAHT
ncbi:MAG TPA: BphX family protein [Chloroflexota bacterium]|nr:BphX family protein [Chloroflexota bacterium]